MAGSKCCQRCGRNFVTTGNRQLRCPPCRRAHDQERAQRTSSGRGFPGFVPEQRECRACGRAFIARVPQQRFCSQFCRRRMPRSESAEARHRVVYDSNHHRRRKAAEQAVASGGVRCARGAACVYAEEIDGVLVGGIIHPGQPFDLGHVDGDPLRYAGPEHRRCNRRTSAHKKARETMQRGRVW